MSVMRCSFLASYEVLSQFTSCHEVLSPGVMRLLYQVMLLCRRGVTS